MTCKSDNIYLLLSLPLLGIFAFSCSSDDDIMSPLVKKYDDVKVIDIHNHDAANYAYLNSYGVWKKYSIDRVVLFGNISEPSAVETDNIAWNASQENPSTFYPFFSGFNIKDSSCIKVVNDNFKKGFSGIGEFVAASTNSPIASKLPWKGDHPMDGNFPQVYQLCEQYHAPILLHIDPPFGYPVEKLKEALVQFPKTNFIFGHANAYNTPANIEDLVSHYTNIYIDFFAGFTRYNSESTYSLEDFAKVIRKYPHRFMVSSDSGYEIGYDKAYSAIYELFDLLDAETVEFIAHQNFESLTANK
jgi:predicted TIM-barrel fold metal-dependent hydrolase